MDEDARRSLATRKELTLRGKRRSMAIQKEIAAFERAAALGPVTAEEMAEKTPAERVA
jgi:hypothetical protein